MPGLVFAIDRREPTLSFGSSQWGGYAMKLLAALHVLVDVPGHGHPEQAAEDDRGCFVGLVAIVDWEYGLCQSFGLQGVR